MKWSNDLPASVIVGLMATGVCLFWIYVLFPTQELPEPLDMASHWFYADMSVFVIPVNTDAGENIVDIPNVDMLSKTDGPNWDFSQAANPTD